MAREENNRYSNIEHIRTNMLWMDIKIVDPEMETLMKQINEEQTKLKEALREKLRLMKYDTDIVKKENEQLKEWLKSKGMQLEEKNFTVEKIENETKIKEEPMDTVTDQNEDQKEKMTMQFSDGRHIETINNNATVQIKNTEVDVNRIKSCDQKMKVEVIKDDPSKKNIQMIKKETGNSDINTQNIKEEFAIETKTCINKQVKIEPVEDILLNKKKVKLGMKRRRLLKKYKGSSKKKMNIKEKIDEVQKNNDIEDQR